MGWILLWFNKRSEHDTPFAIKPPSKLVRKQALPKSPYENQRPASLLEYLEPSVSEKDNTNLFRYTNRQIRRLYKKLLQQVPLINVIHSDQLWEQRNYTITKSQWVPQGLTKVLNDIPSSQVIETTLLSTKKKHIRRSWRIDEMCTVLLECK